VIIENDGMIFGTYCLTKPPLPEEVPPDDPLIPD
jgi:hypothetical protein